MKINRSSTRRPRYAILVALYYMAVASAWVLFSDRLLKVLFADQPRLIEWQTFNSLLFVFLSGLIIFALVHVVSNRQQKAETQLRQLSRAVEQSASAVVITSSDGLIEYVNPRFTELSGYQLHEVLGQNPRLLKSGNTSAVEYAALWDTITNGHDWRGELLNKRKDGGTYWVSASISPIRDARGQITHFLAVQEDITERKRAQEKIEQRNRELTLLNRIISAAVSTLKVEEVLSVACREVAETFGVPQVAVALSSEDMRSLHVVAEHGAIRPQQEAGVGTQVPIEGNPSLERMVGQQEPCVLENVLEDVDSEPLRESMARRGVASVLLVPLLIRGELMGLIELDSGEVRQFTGEEIALASNVAAAVSQALDNARLYEEVASHNDVLVQAIADHTQEFQRVRDRVEAILNNSPDAILLVQPEGRIETANPTFSQLFGVEGDAYNYPVSQLVGAEDLARLKRAIKLAFEEDRVMRLEVTARRSDESTFDAGIALAAFDEGDKRRLVCVVRDITALKEVERMKDAFVSNVSHELRTPITSLKLHHHLLRINPDKQEVYMDRLDREIGRLSHIIEDLLTLSRMDQDRISPELESVNVNTLLAQYVADREILAQQRGLRIVHAPAAEVPLVEIDRGLIGQVLSVLLTNAFSYTPSGGQVEVRARQREENGECWVGFSVSDTGNGIPLEEQPYVFERFFRGQVAKETGAPGTGLGLAIASEIVERHGGTIEVNSSGVPGGGAAFHVWLPVERRAAPSGPSVN